MTKDNAVRLALYTDLLKLSDNSYLQDENNANFTYVRNRYFDNNLEKTRILNIWSWLFTAVSNTIWTFIDYPIMDMRVEGLIAAVSDYVSLWFSIFVLERDEEWEKLVRWYAGWYVTDKWVSKIFRQYQQVDENDYTYYFLYEKTYEIWRIIRKLYKLKGKDQFESWYEQVDLNTIEETRWFDPITKTGFKYSSLFVVGNLDDMSIIQKVIPNVYSIDRKICMLDSQFLQNMESIILFKWLTATEAWFTKKKSELRNRAIFTDDIDTSVEFIKNTNDIIDKAMTYEDKQIRAVSAMTNVPLRFLWLDESDGSSGRNARMLTQSAFIKMLDGIKTEYKKVFEKILKWLSKDTLVRFQDTVLKDSYDLAEEMKIAREAQIISQKEAIRKYQNLDSEHAEKELKAIEAETPEVEVSETAVNLWGDSSQEKDNWPRERKERDDK